MRVLTSGRHALGRLPQIFARLACPRIPPGGVLVGRRTNPVRLPPPPCQPGADDPLPDRTRSAGHALAAVFEPRRVALVGASEVPGKMGELFWRNLSTFPGEVIPVTRSAGTVAGSKAYPALSAVEGDVDLAVVVVPAPAAPAVVRDAAAKGVPAVVVISGGFAEAGPERVRLQDELMAAARAGGVRLVGPNCLGVQNCDLPLNASLAEGTPRGGGGISLVTQSGAYGMAIHSVGLDERARFAKVYAA